jgi:hypothetical protein
MYAVFDPVLIPSRAALETSSIGVQLLILCFSLPAAIVASLNQTTKPWFIIVCLATLGGLLVPFEREHNQVIG